MAIVDTTEALASAVPVRESRPRRFSIAVEARLAFELGLVFALEQRERRLEVPHVLLDEVHDDGPA